MHDDGLTKIEALEVFEQWFREAYEYAHGREAGCGMSETARVETIISARFRDEGPQLLRSLIAALKEVDRLKAELLMAHGAVANGW